MLSLTKRPQGQTLISDQQIAQIIDADAQFPINFDDAYQWIGYSTKGNAKSVLTRNFKRDADYLVFMNSDKNPNGGRPSEEILLTVDCFKGFCLLAQTERGNEVRQAFIEVEKQHRVTVKAYRQLLDEHRHAQAELHELHTNLQRLQLAQAWNDVIDRSAYAKDWFLRFERYERMGLSITEMMKLLECGKSTINRYRKVYRPLVQLGADVHSTPLAAKVTAVQLTLGGVA